MENYKLDIHIHTKRNVYAINYKELGFDIFKNSHDETVVIVDIKSDDRAFLDWIETKCKNNDLILAMYQVHPYGVNQETFFSQHAQCFLFEVRFDLYKLLRNSDDIEWLLANVSASVEDYYKAFLSSL